MIDLRKIMTKVAFKKAIKVIRTDIITKELSSTTDAVRAIKRFESINEIQFNPFNKQHVNRLAGCGSHEHFFRKAKLVFKNLKQQEK